MKTTSTRGQQGGDVTIVSEIDVFAHPTQKIVSTLKLAGTVNSQGITSGSTIATIKSQGLGIDIQYTEEAKVDRSTYSGEYLLLLKYHVGNSNYNNEFSIKGGKTQANVIVRLLNVDLLRASSRLNLNKEEQIIDSEVSSYDNNPVVSHLEVKNFNTFKYTVGFKSK